MIGLINFYLKKFYADERLPFVIRFEYPNKTFYQNRAGTPDIKIIFTRRWSLFVIALLWSYGFITEYVKQRIDIEGDLRYLPYLASANSVSLAGQEKHWDQMNPLVRLMNWWHMRRYEGITREKALWNAYYKYGHPPDYWFNFLGKTGGYTCGYWTPETNNVDEAEHNKFDYVCKKIKLDRPGLRVATVGGGSAILNFLRRRNMGPS